MAIQTLTAAVKVRTGSTHGHLNTNRGRDITYRFNSWPSKTLTTAVKVLTDLTRGRQNYYNVFRGHQNTNRGRESTNTGSTRGRQNYYNVFRGATGFMTYTTAIRDIIVTDTKACVWLDLKVIMRALRSQTVFQTSL